MKDELEGFSEYRDRWTSWYVDRPFTNEIEAERWIERHIEYCNNRQVEREYVERYSKEVTNIQKDIGDDTVLVIESPVGPDTAYSLLGLELFSYLQADHPNLVSDWLEALNEREIRRAKTVASPVLVPVVLTYSDIAYNGRTLFSI